MRRYLATVGKAHRSHGLEDPTKDELVRLTARTFFRGRGTQAQAAPIHWADVAAFAALGWADVRQYLTRCADQPIADHVRTALRGEAQLRRARPGELPTLLGCGKRLSENEVNRTFKAAMWVLAKPVAEVAQVSGHSTRAGAAQDSRDAGMTLVELMGSGGWKDPKMPARNSRKQGTTRSGMAKMMAMKSRD